MLASEQNRKNWKRNRAERKSLLSIILMILAVLLIAFGIVCAIWHDAAYAVFRNLTAKSYPLSETDDWDGGTSWLNVPYSDVSDSDYVSIYVPDDVENPPLLVIVHGGGFVTDDNTNRPSQRMYRYFRDHGYACASVNYRLAQEAAYPGALQDVKACIRYLKANADQYGYDADHIAIFGESAGGYLACATALSDDTQFNDLDYIGEKRNADGTPKISAEVDILLDFYGACYFRNTEEMWKELKIPGLVRAIANSWISGSVLEGYEDVHSFWLRKNVSEMTDEEYRSICMTGFIEDSLPSHDNLAVWISHGDCDITVPVLVSEKFREELLTVLDEDQVELNIVHNAGHASDILFSDEQLAKIESFMEKQFQK